MRRLSTMMLLSMMLVLWGCPGDDDDFAGDDDAGDDDTGDDDGGDDDGSDDDGGDGSTSLIDETLTAGTWFFVVDGFGSSPGGDYTFEVQVLDP